MLSGKVNISVQRLHITYIGALPGNPPARTMRLEADADYCTACAELRKDLAANYDAIWVKHKHHFTWLTVFVEHTGIVDLRPVDCGTTTARDVLAARWSLPIPEWLTDTLILEEDLLTRELPAGAHETVAAALLAPWIDSLSVKFPRDQAGLLAERASASVMQAGLVEHPSAHAAWEHTICAWADTDANATLWVGAFCERLRDNPNKLWCDLTLWRLLHSYPHALQEFALDPAAMTFVRTVPIDALKGMSLSSEGKALALDQIQPLFEQTGAVSVSRNMFVGLLESVSGELREEFCGLTKILEHVAFQIEPSDVAAVIRRFKQCVDINPSAFAQLELYIRPPLPKAMEATEPDAVEWLKWVHSEYLPYRWWQTQRGEADPAVEQTVGQFSEWYCQKFSQIHGDPSLSAVQALTQWRSLIMQDTVSLVLLVDNLPWCFWDSFEHALAVAGLHRHESKDCFVPLPSHTSVCKPILVSGRWDATGSDYHKMLEARSIEEWGGRPVHYLAGVDQLNAMKNSSSPAVILLNYLASDEALHADSAAAGTTHTEQLGLLYTSLANAVGNFARRATGGNRVFGLYVITDHGATCILPAEKQSADALLTKRFFPNDKYRSATMSVAEANEIPENLWAFGHRFVNPYNSDGAVHFIPRGHNTVAAPGPRPLYSHGGATPEEVIVPCGVFRLFPAEWVIPSVRFLNLTSRDGKAQFYVKRIANVTIEIQNQNAAECHVESVSITPPVGEVRAFDRVTVGAQSVGGMKVSLYFTASATATFTLTFEISFRVAQQSLVRRVEIPVLISSVTFGGTDLTTLVP
jgi:hypothetical protein